NSYADRKRTNELLKSKFAYIKSLIGYSPERDFSLAVNTKAMEQHVLLDTTQILDPQNRIEYRLLQTQRQLQGINTSYNKAAYLPTLSNFINNTINYQINNFSNLLNHSFTVSVVRLRLNIPIFQGTKGIHEIRRSLLQQ